MNHSHDRRRWLLCAVALAAGGPAAAQGDSRPLVEVWKSPTCGCCKEWISHLEANGFRVRIHDEGNTNARAALRMPMQYGSCHTAKVGGYAIEGHVPAREIKRLLKERPGAIGLAVPGMPVGSPGMDGPDYGDRKDPYDVLLVQAEGKASIYQSYR
jgi:hypothetical protein